MLGRMQNIPAGLEVLSYLLQDGVRDWLSQPLWRVICPGGPLLSQGYCVVEVALI